MADPDSEREVWDCYLYNGDPVTRLERELIQMTGEGFNGGCSLDAVMLTDIDSMHYCGNAGTDAMLHRFPQPRTEGIVLLEQGSGGDTTTTLASSSTAAPPSLRVLDLGSGFGGCARYVASKLPHATVTALELQAGLDACGAALTSRCGPGLAARVSHVCGDMLELGGGCGSGGRTSPGLPEGNLLPERGAYDVVYSKLAVLHIPLGARPGLWRRVARCGKAGGLLHLEDYFAAAPLRPREEADLLELLGCPGLPTRDQYVSQLEAAGFSEVEFHDVSAAWQAYVGERASDYATHEARHLKVHGRETFKQLNAFYRCTDALFAGGRLGGCTVTARFPAKAAAEAERVVRHTAVPRRILPLPAPFSPPAEAAKHGFVPLERMVVLALRPKQSTTVAAVSGAGGGVSLLPELPEEATTRQWPVCFVETSSLAAAVEAGHLASPTTAGSAAAGCEGALCCPYALCGAAADVATALGAAQRLGLEPPLFTLSDSPEDLESAFRGSPWARVNGGVGEAVFAPVAHHGVPSLFHFGLWEEAVSVACACHAATIPEMILSRARAQPTAVALRGAPGWGTLAEHAAASPPSPSSTSPDSPPPSVSVSYSDLCTKAWAVGEAISSTIRGHVDAVAAQAAASPGAGRSGYGGVVASSGLGRIAAQVFVGVTLPPSPSAAVCLLALGLRRWAHVVVAPAPKELAAYQLSRVPCAALLALSTASPSPLETSSVQSPSTTWWSAPTDGGPVTVYVDLLFRELFGDNSSAGSTAASAPPASAAHVRPPLPSLDDVRAPGGGSGALWDASTVEWTSGSTGKPKAMAVTAWRLSHWIRWRQFHFPLDTFGRRVGVGLFWAWYWHIPLCQGGEVVVIPAALTVDVCGMVRGHGRSLLNLRTPGFKLLFTCLPPPFLISRMRPLCVFPFDRCGTSRRTVWTGWTA